MTLYEPLVMSVRYCGRDYRLTPWYDRVLHVYDIMRDKTFTDYERADIALSLLVRGRYPADAGLLSAIFDALTVLKPRASSARAVDFIQDAPYIYAGFMQAYGIDLYKAQGRLHWQKFVALFASLPRETRMMQIVEIRTRELPKPTKYNAEERAAIMRQKAIYALEISAEDREEAMQNALRGMVGALTTMAQKGGNNG